MELDDDDDNYVIRDSDARPIRSRSIFRLSSSIFSCTSGSFSSVVAALRSLHLLSEDRNLAVVRVDPLGDNQLLAFRRGDVRPDGDLRLHLLPSHDRDAVGPPALSDLAGAPSPACRSLSSPA